MLVGHFDKVHKLSMRRNLITQVNNFLTIQEGHHYCQRQREELVFCAYKSPICGAKPVSSYARFRRSHYFTIRQTGFR